jgi:hypothetical protein
VLQGHAPARIAGATATVADHLGVADDRPVEMDEGSFVLVATLVDVAQHFSSVAA